MKMYDKIVTLCLKLLLLLVSVCLMGCWIKLGSDEYDLITNRESSNQSSNEDEMKSIKMEKRIFILNEIIQFLLLTLCVFASTFNCFPLIQSSSILLGVLWMSKHESSPDLLWLNISSEDDNWIKVGAHALHLTVIFVSQLVACFLSRPKKDYIFVPIKKSSHSTAFNSGHDNGIGKPPERKWARASIMRKTTVHSPPGVSPPISTPTTNSFRKNAFDSLSRHEF